MAHQGWKYFFYMVIREMAAFRNLVISDLESHMWRNRFNSRTDINVEPQMY